MQTFEDANRMGVLLRFDAPDCPSLTADEVSRFVRMLFVPHSFLLSRWSEDAAERSDRAVREMMREHIASAERHAICYRPGGYDANGAPLP